MIGLVLLCVFATSPIVGSADPSARDAADQTAKKVVKTAGLPLSDIAWIREMDFEEASESPPVRVRGVVTNFNSNGKTATLFIQDDTAGIFVHRMPSHLIAIGRVLEIEGYVSDEGFTPLIRPLKWKRIGTADLPQPINATFADFEGGFLDAQWTEIEGTLRSIEPRENGFTNLKLQLHGGSMDVLVREAVSARTSLQIGATIRARGVAVSTKIRTREFVEAWLSCPGFHFVEVKDPGVSDPFGLPVRDVASLLSFDVDGSPKEPIHVKGVVVHRDKFGGEIFIDDRATPIKVMLSEMNANEREIQVGNSVSVVGFIAQQGLSSVLEDAIVRVTGNAEPVLPVPMDGEEAFSGFYDGKLVALDAVLVDYRRHDKRVSLILDAGSMTCEASGRWPKVDGEREQLVAGSRLRVVGIHQPRYDPIPKYQWTRSGTLQLLMRSADDIRVLQTPPWWNAQRFLVLVIAVLGLVLIAAYSFYRWSNEKLRSQESVRRSAERQFAAVLEERGRLARELHDTLAQGLTSISMQIECARDCLTVGDKDVVHHLDTAGDLVRQSLTDARHSIGNIRSHILEGSTLSQALAKIGHQLTDGTNILFSSQVTGDEIELPEQSLNHLLRIGQEAITNAVKHAGATEIVLSIEYDSDAVVLMVIDDGSGISETLPRDSNPVGFGMRGMRERVSQMDGQLTVESSAQTGTRVSVKLAT